MSATARLAAAVDEVMNRGIGSSTFPAAVLLVTQGSAQLYHNAYGFLDPEDRKRPAQVDTLFDLASLTKLFTALAFMTLVDAGLVSVDTPVVTVLPEFGGIRRIGFSQDPVTKELLAPEPAFAGQQVEAREVTFRHLLTHTSGLAAWRSLFEVGADPAAQVAGAVTLTAGMPAQIRARRVAAIWEDNGFAAPPGARLIYSDLGYILLGEAVARLAGDRFAGPQPHLSAGLLEIAIDESIIKPLGLQRTTFNPLSHGYQSEEIAPTGVCRWRRRPLLGEVNDENAASLGGAAGHAGLFATAQDVAAMGQMMLDLGLCQGKQVLAPATVMAMTTEQVSQEGQRRGLGWMLQGPGTPVGPGPGPRSFGHTGFTGTSLWVDPDLGLVTVLLTNRVYFGWDLEAISAFRPRLHTAVVELARALPRAENTHNQPAAGKETAR